MEIILMPESKTELSRRCLTVAVRGALLVVALFQIGTARAQTLTLVTNPPPTGTFYSYTLLQAPFPFNPFPELTVYATDNGAYVYDDRQVDYVALRAEQNAAMLSASGFGGGMQMMTLQSPPPPGGGGGGSGGGGGTTSSPPYSVSGLKVTIPIVTNTDLYVTIFEHNPAMPYDIYKKLNLNLTNWTIASTGIVAQTNFYIPNNFTNQVFFMAGLGADLDGDGIKDGEEALVWKTDPLLADTDGDGLSDGYELFTTFTDPFSAGPVPTLHNRSISKCPLP